MSSSPQPIVSRDAKRSANRPGRSARRGFSLIEMMVVISLSALLLGVATSLLFSLRDRDRHSREDNLHGEQMFRLAESLRADIRQGADVLLSIDGPLVVISPDGIQTRYELNRNGCQRSTVAPGDAGPRHDLFAIGRAQRWQVERLATGRRPLVAVTLEQATVDGESRAAPLLVYAALGADATSTAAAD
jgi:prepilin-type N-terminal cleavage/methylation domain-containing protein